MKLHEKIIQIRESKRISRAEMANHLNMASQSYWNIETGKVELTISRLTQIAEILGVPIVELLSDENQKVEDPGKISSLENLIQGLENDKSNLQVLIEHYKSMIRIFYPVLVDGFKSEIIPRFVKNEVDLKKGEPRIREEFLEFLNQLASNTILWGDFISTSDFSVEEKVILEQILAKKFLRILFLKNKAQELLKL